MKLLTYDLIDDCKTTFMHKDVSKLCKEDIEKLKWETKDRVEGDKVGGSVYCENFEVMEISNALDLILVVGFNNAINYRPNIRKCLNSLNLE